MREQNQRRGGAPGTSMLAVACLFLCAGANAMASPAKLYVSPKGMPGWSGRLDAPNAARTDGPLPTLQSARDLIRQWKSAGKLPKGGVIVELRGGTRDISAPIAFTEADSGTADAPIVYQARKGEEVRLSAGRSVGGWSPVTDADVLARLEPAARGHVIQADLRAQGITDLAGIARPGQWAVSSPGLELIFKDKPMTIARWPNQGFVKIVDTVKTEPYDIRGTWGDKVGKFVYDGDRPKRWAGEKEIWLHGYWFWDWADERMKVDSIDNEKRVITLAKPEHAYGYRKGQWYYAFNLLSELDEPGEWYLDRDAGVLYFWPPSEMEPGRAVVTLLPSVITMKSASHITFRGIVLEGARGTAVTVSGGEDVRFVGCTIRNCGGWAASITGARNSGVTGCDIYQTGDGGVLIEGGDRKTLTPAGLFVDNCHIHHYSRWNPVYKPGVMMNGVGNRITHSLIDNAPHMAIGFGGNDHLIEFNEIHSVCYESNDAGAMYAGRNWTMRGTIIRHNYLHHTNGFEGRGCVGVYLDDQYCGTRIEGNVFYKVTRAAMIGGGRDCTIENNVFVDCVPATHVDARGLGWAKDGFAGLKHDLEALPYKQEPWSTKYPKLVGILDDDPMAPKGNLIARNILVGGRWGDFEGSAKPLVTFENNLLEGDPKFVDVAHANFQLQKDSPAWKLGFQRIPIEQIGPYRSPDRASWPVTSAVRPMAEPPAPLAKRSAGPRPVAAARELNADARGSGVPVLVLAQGVNGEKLIPPSTATVARSGDQLYVAFNNEVDPAKPLLTGSKWGRDDAVEIAIRDVAAGKDAPIIVLRGYVNGKFESSGEAGASDSAVRRAAEGVQYSAEAATPGRWTCSFFIPFRSLGIDPAKHHRFDFNLSVRKTAGDQWIMWRGTGAHTWDVGEAGVLELAR